MNDWSEARYKVYRGAAQGELNMTLSEIKEKVIKPLPRTEKLQLIADISMMLKEEENLENALAQKVNPKAIYPLFTPLGMEEAAVKLQEFIDNEEG